MKYIIVILCLAVYSVNGQNLIPSDSWTVGSGTCGIFGQWGATEENERVVMETPYGEQGVVWKSANSDLVPNDGPGASDGGWVTSEVSIDHTQDYRFSVWMKKTNSHQGSSYFGCGYWSQNLVKLLNGSDISNPYFFASDLPELNKWYLLVGYVMNSSYTQTTNIGGVYSGSTYQKVRGLTDYKFNSTTTVIRQRVFLYYDDNLNDVQYYYAPRIDLMDGSEPSIDDLLRYDLTGATKTVCFNYDASGNRTDRYLGVVAVGRSSEVSAAESVSDTIYNNKPHILETVIDQNLVVNIYPNPTKGQMKLEVLGLSNFEDSRYKMFDINGKQILQTSSLNALQTVDIEHLPAGNYILKIEIQGKDYQWKIIKQ